MIYEGNKVSDLNIAYVGGGSQQWAWNLMSDLAVEEQLSGTVKLYDIRQQAAADNAVIGNRLSARSDVKGKWVYKAVESLQEALTGADFVVISILPGTFKEMASDVHVPEEYGIYQSVGDTTGPGGIVRALRTIPMYVEIAENIKKYSPNAWVINYTNPMTLCTRTLYEVFPEVKAFGCCHEVFGTQGMLADMLKKMKGMEVGREEIKTNVLGINHFTWIDKATCRGMDLFPLYRQYVDENYEEGVGERDASNCFNSTNRVKFDLFRRYGLIAAAGDRHLAEFCPPWYLKNPETVEEWKFGLTPVDLRVKWLGERAEKSRRLMNGEEEIELKKSGEEGVKQIKALLGLGDLVTNVNLPNAGQMRNIPYGAVVETNAHFSKDNITPLFAGELPADVNSLVMRHVINQETTLKSALTKDTELAFRAFANDPLVTVGISDARRLFYKMLKNTEEYLPGWNLK